MSMPAESLKARRREYFRLWRLRRMTADERIVREQKLVARAQARIVREEDQRIVRDRARAVHEQRKRFALARDEAIAAGFHTYIGRQCKCGGAVRYVGTGSKCKACNDARTLAWLKARRAQMTTPEPLVAAGRLGSITNRTDERGQHTKNTG